MPPIKGRHVVTLDESVTGTLRELLGYVQEEQDEPVTPFSRAGADDEWEMGRGEVSVRDALVRLERDLQKMVGYQLSPGKWEEPKGFANKREALDALDFISGGTENIVAGNERISAMTLLRAIAEEHMTPPPRLMDEMDGAVSGAALDLADEIEQGGTGPAIGGAVESKGPKKPQPKKKKN